MITEKGATEGAVYAVELVDYRGNVVDMVRFSKNDLIQETMTLNLNAAVKEGKNYSIQITAPEGALALRYKQVPWAPSGRTVSPCWPVGGMFGFASATWPMRTP